MRSPSRVDSDVRELAQVLPGPVPISILVDGSRQFRSEELIAYELGYRKELSRNSRPMSPCITTTTIICARYSFSRSTWLHPPRSDSWSRMAPKARATGNGRGSWRVLSSWRLRASYTYLHMFARIKAGHEGDVADIRPGFNPAHEASLESSVALSHGVDFDARFRYVDSLPLPRVPGYVEADARLAWTPRPDLTFSLVGQDLLHARHAEFPPTFFSLEAREIERRGYAKVVWRF